MRNWDSDDGGYVSSSEEESSDDDAVDSTVSSDCKRTIR